MDQIRESLERITELSDDELQGLKDSIIKEFKAVEKQDNSREVVDAITQLADAADAVEAERTRRESEATELAAAREAATARLTGNTDEAAEGEPEVEDLEDDEEIDPATGKKRKKKSATEPTDAAPVAEASVVDPAESVTTADAELAVEQPSVQPDEVKDSPVAGKPDADVTSPAEQAEDHPEVLPVKGEEPKAEEEAEAEADEARAEESKDDEVVEDKKEESADDKESEDDKEADEADDNTEEEGSEETVTAAGTPELEAPEGRGLKVQASAPVTIVAGANIKGIAAGSELSGLNDVAKAMDQRMRTLGTSNPGADGEQITIATFQTSYPEDRTLSSSDKDANTIKVHDVVSREAITAAGGLCAPVTVSYDIYGFGVLDRPVRDSLPVFAADRGGIRFVTPPTLDDLTGAVSLWTLQDDIDAATAGAPDPVKPCIRVNCGTEVVVYTDAIPLCLTFGNLNSRAWPELIERHTELGMISHARYAETRLLTRIGSLSTSVTANKQLGAARDFFVQLEQAAAGYRNRHRLSPTETLRVLLPEWFRNALRADLTKQLPGDGQEVTFNLTNAQIDSYFRARNVEPSWFLDGETGQIMADQNAGALNPFPTTLVWYLFSEGTFLFLDGGTLDLGLVRDSTLNGTNDYKIFLETFEGVAKVGIESLRVTTTVGIHGASAATVNTVA